MQQLRLFFLQNVEVNYVEGLNYDNYYYCKNNIIYWITLAAKILCPVLRFYELLSRLLPPSCY